MEHQLELVVGFVVGLAMTFAIIPWLIPKLKEKGIVGEDLNKPHRPKIVEMGGIAVVIGFFAGISVALVMDGVANKELLYVSLSAILGAAFVGILDDMFELRHRQKAFFPFLLALPLGAALDSRIHIPFIGEIEFGVLMIIVAPFAITCAANAGNMLEGFNGLGTGLGIIMSCTLIILGLQHNRLDGLYILAPLLGGLMAFLWFNRYPAKVFPGDTLMLFIGAAIAVGGMLSNLYIQTTVIFLPMIIEFLLKLRGRFKAENYCSDASNGHLEYNGRIESLTHVFMKRMRLTEKGLVAVIWSVEMILCTSVVLVDFLI
jgi:UDP-N-acetylglucosamine--dolichyl-phosphate N-acetylglucosaminephosphotransferase